ncbi:cytochrome o ubiquinol oxidase subunit IV [Acidimangrovimonas sediminis]|uniref:cytochrome o ubiquinol oxidase subunit IV n=1 Tax=Acidimangrovimonas sediminis TaxID=2056283 RepID=UPI000C7FBFFA|nr:cytochrome o ubiquinol oxidase subunit IV [Acidimangrovimonas sediminis]
MSTPGNLSNEEAYKHDLKGYVTGLIAAAVLTIIPFVWVGFGLPTGAGLWIIAILGIIQVIVHVRYFLHVDLSPEHRDELHLLAFSALLLFIMAAGTIWVLLNMNYRMMPGMEMMGM